MLTRLFALLLLPVAAFAQTGNAIAKGSILDPARASVPGARIGLTNTGTNTTVSNRSSLNGDYFFGNIAPGRYLLGVEAA